MEADWSAEVGGDLPLIAVPWAGFVDLRSHPEGVSGIAEAAAYPALREALILLNRPGAPVFTSKCDVWTLERAEIDPYEFDCDTEDGGTGVASYIDVIARDAAVFGAFDRHEAWVRFTTQALRRLPVRNGRVDLTIRAASLDARMEREFGFGVTLYAAGCGASADAALTAWGAVLLAAVTATMNTGVLLNAGE